MKYLNNKLKKRLNKYEQFELYIYIEKWIKFNELISFKDKHLLRFNLKKKVNFNLISVNKFHSSCNFTWRSRVSIIPFYISKSQIKFYTSNNRIMGLRKN